MKSSKLQNFTVWSDNAEEYHQLKREVFGQHSYYFETDSPTPLIIDAGAHIGLATLYFKNLYPEARIIAIEPNPKTYAVLEKNIWENQIEGVETINCALARSQSNNHPFYLDESPLHWWSTAGFSEGAWTGDQKSQKISVATKPLDDFLTEQVDYLKLDIEGAEQEVLTASRNLGLVKQLSCEFHPHPGQSLSTIVEYLERLFTVRLLKGSQPVLLKKAQGLIQIEGVNRKLA
jgi:FkbM family methyltransferase